MFYYLDKFIVLAFRKCDMAVNSFFQFKINQSFDFLANELQVSGDAFTIDFHRTSEIKLIVNEKKRVHYRKSDFGDNVNFDSKFEKVRTQFVTTLRDINPKLETAIKTMLHQGGPFYSGRNAMENFIFPSLALQGRGLIHEITIEVNSSDDVIVREVTRYNGLQLNSPELAKNLSFSAKNGVEINELTWEEKQTLETYRNLIFWPGIAESFSQMLMQGDGNGSLVNDSHFGDEGLIKLEQSDRDKENIFGFLSLHEPLSLTVNYQLYYDLKAKKFKLYKPKATDINIDFSAPRVEKLICGSCNNDAFKSINFLTKAQQELTKLINKFIETLKKAIITAIDHVFYDEEPADESFNYINRLRA